MSIYKDRTKPIEERVEDLLSRMTIDEKIAQMKATLPMTVMDGDQVNYEKLKSFAKDGLGRMPQFTMASMKSAKETARIYNEIQHYMIEETRLGIPFLTQLECLNGVMGADAESFPSPIALAGSFAPEKVREMGEVISKQMKATGLHFGLTPVVDLARDPRWGRVYETFGEDVYLTSVMGTNVVKGLQQNDIRNHVASCGKHFLAYSVSSGGLNTAEISVGRRELTEQHAAPWEAMIREAGLQGIMCTYSAIDGEPVSVSKSILTDLLRGRLGFEGTAVCDGGSIERAQNNQAAGLDMTETAAMAVKAGLCSDAPRTMAYHLLPEALERGILTEEDIEKQVRLILTQKFKLGLFDEPYVDLSKVDEAYDRTFPARLNRSLCDESITLLKNEGNILPISNDGRKIAVIGPHGGDASAMFGGYTYLDTVVMFDMMQRHLRTTMEGVSSELRQGDAVAEVLTYGMSPEDKAAAVKRIGEIGVKKYILEEKYGSRSVFEAINRKCGGNAVYSRGSGILDGSDDELKAAVETAKSVDVVILTIGDKCGWGPDSTSGEGKDRMSLDLPEAQERLLRAVCGVNKNVVVVLFNGRPLSINYAAEHAAAIIEAWFTGPFGGDSVADAIFGDVNPSGKLPISIPRSSMQIPVFYSHKYGSGYSPDDNKGEFGGIINGGNYTDGPATPLYYFGHGLSYTEFVISGLKLDKAEVDTRSNVRISCDVKNVGKRKGSEVVQIYLAVRGLPVTRPKQQLAAFEKVELEAGENAHLEFVLPMDRVGYIDSDLKLNVRPCHVEVQAGSSSKNIIEKAKFEVVGESVKYDHAQSFFTKCNITRS